MKLSITSAVSFMLLGYGLKAWRVRKTLHGHQAPVKDVSKILRTASWEDDKLPAEEPNLSSKNTLITPPKRAAARPRRSIISPLHLGHCCPLHGCSYGEHDCPVAVADAEPYFAHNNGCETCSTDKNLPV